jgi:hypothetical protein
VFGSEDILFEYGAESGALQPPWDYAGAKGSGTKSGAGIVMDSTHVRTGTEAIKIYQPSPPKSDAQRRVEAGFSSHSETEFYWSFWTYFPTGYDEVANQSSWLNIGGITLYWGDDDADDGGRWSKGLRSRFTVGKDGTGLYARGTWTANDLTDDWVDFWHEGDKHYLTMNEWHHFQLYMKVGVNDGIITTWIDDVQNLHRTNEHTDPAYWGEPEAGDSWSHGNEFYSLGITQYGDQDTTPALEVWYDDMMCSTEKVPEEYGLDYPSLEFENWEDGFETGDFTNWNGTQYGGGGIAPSVTSTYVYSGIYSANFTTDGTQDSYSRAMHIVQDTNEVYQRSFVRLEDLPDTSGSILWVLRVAQEDGTWISSAGVNLTDGLYYWHIQESGGTRNYTQQTINADVWYELEYYFNATTNGKATLWVNGTLMCDMTGDFTNDIAMVYPYLYCDYENQVSPKTVLHDNYWVDSIRIGSGTPMTPEQWETFWSMGDVNEDGYINVTDFNLIVEYFGTSNPQYDINESGFVDLNDLMICVGNYGLDIWTHFSTLTQR